MNLSPERAHDELYEAVQVAFVHDGSFYHLATIEDLVEEGFPIRPCYLVDLLSGEDSLSDVRRLFVADRLHPRLWERAAARCVDVARRGGVLFLSGENSVDAVPHVTARRTETNYWWWVTGEDPAITIHQTNDPLQRELTARALRWHHHHVLHVRSDAEVLASHSAPEDPEISGALLVVDRHSTPGVIAVAGLDPVYHHGSRFMPGASELLRGVLRWMCTAPMTPADRTPHGEPP